MTTNAYPIKSIVIEEGVTSGGEYAFSDYCDYGWMVEDYNSPTQSITFPDTLVTVGNYAFNGFRFLDADGKSIPASAESLRGHTFELAYWMTFRMADIVEGKSFSVGGVEYTVTSADAPEVSATGYEGGVSAVPSSVLYKGTDIPVASVAAKAFYGCGSLTSADLTCARSIGMKAFANCSSLTDISFGEGLESIGAYAFYGLSFYDGETKLQVSPEALGGHSFSGTAQKLYLIS